MSNTWSESIAGTLRLTRSENERKSQNTAFFRDRQQMEAKPSALAKNDPFALA